MGIKFLRHIKDTNWLIFMEITSVHSENHAKHIHVMQRASFTVLNVVKMF